MSAHRTSVVEETSSRTSPDTPWLVVVHNDPVNLMGYVVMVFRKVLAMEKTRAEKHMLEVHHRGRSVVWSGAREPAEHRVHELQSWHLRTTLEKDDDAGL